MTSNQSLSSQGLSTYPSIKAFSTLLSLLTQSQTSTVPLSAQILLDLCRNIARDLTYISRLQEDAQLALNNTACPSYHAQWIREVRTAASESLYRANKHIENRLPDTEALYQLTYKSKHGDLLAKVASVTTPGKKDGEDVGSLLKGLSAAQASLMGAMGFLQQLAFRSSGELLSPQDAAQLARFKCFSSDSLLGAGQVTPISPPAVEEMDATPRNLG